MALLHTAGSIRNSLENDLHVHEMRYGFTGTREGMSIRQKKQLKDLLSESETHTLSHGDCIGADADAHSIAVKTNIFKIIIHPPTDTKCRVNCLPRPQTQDTIKAAKPYLQRNRAIVDSCDVLIACPRTMDEELRSGTWSTVRYARKICRPVIILEP